MGGGDPWLVARDDARLWGRGGFKNCVRKREKKLCVCECVCVWMCGLWIVDCGGGEGMETVGDLVHSPVDVDVEDAD